MPLVPKLVTTLKGYTKDQFILDLFAGCIVGIVAIPLALAFGIASGVTPAQGLYTAIIGGFIVSALGGSRVQIGGPTGAFVVIVYGIIQQYGMGGLTLCTIMAGVILIVMGLSRMGSLIKFIPYPVITGFTSGIAVVIFSSEIKDLLGLRMGAVPPEFIAKWQSFFAASGTTSWEAAGLAALTLVILGLWPKVTHKLPGPIVALVTVTIIAQALHLPVETIGTRFGGLPKGLPMPVIPDIPWRALPALIRPATTVALLAAIESLLSAVVADGMIGGRHRSNMELIAQGVANIASPLFGGIPVTGAIARTATNIKSGGRTPVAGIVHAVVLAMVLLFLGRWVAMIPLCVLAAILVVVCYHMSEWRSFVYLLKSPRSDVAVLLTTFLLTILVDLTVAVEVGMVLAAFLFMRHMAEATHVDSFTRQMEDEGGGDAPLRSVPLPPGVELFDINGPFFFGAASKLGEVLATIQKPPSVFILGMHHVPSMDATGLRALEDFQARCRRMGTILVLSGVKPEPLKVIEHAGKRHSFDKITTTGGTKEALKFAENLLS